MRIVILQPLRRIRDVLTARNVKVLGRTLPAVTALIQIETKGHCAIRCGLQLGIDRGRDMETLFDRILAVALDHFLADHFSDVWRVHLDFALVRRGVHGRSLRLLHFGGADVAQLVHALQDVIAADLGALGIVERITGRRELGHAR